MTKTLKDVVSQILKSSRNSYMISIAKKSLSLNKPISYSNDLLHDRNVLAKFNNSEIGAIYWFVRDSGTSMVIFTNKSSGVTHNDYKEIKEEMSIISEIWSMNKHHFHVTPNTCRSITKADFMKKALSWLESGKIIYKS
jgi:hypothetical protein